MDNKKNQLYDFCYIIFWGVILILANYAILSGIFRFYILITCVIGYLFGRILCSQIIKIEHFIEKPLILLSSFIYLLLTPVRFSVVKINSAITVVFKNIIKSYQYYVFRKLKRHKISRVEKYFRKIL